MRTVAISVLLLLSLLLFFFFSPESLFQNILNRMANSVSDPFGTARYCLYAFCKTLFWSRDLKGLKHLNPLNLEFLKIDSSISEFGHIHCKYGLSQKSIIYVKFLNGSILKRGWQTVKILMRRLATSRLIWIYTVCQTIRIGLQG